MEGSVGWLEGTKRILFEGGRDSGSGTRLSSDDEDRKWRPSATESITENITNDKRICTYAVKRRNKKMRVYMQSNAKQEITDSRQEEREMEKIEREW